MTVEAYRRRVEAMPPAPTEWTFDDFRAVHADLPITAVKNTLWWSSRKDATIEVVRRGSRHGSAIYRRRETRKTESSSSANPFLWRQHARA